MLFNSASYLVFLPIVVLGYYLLPQKVKVLWLLAASYFFYMKWNAVYILLMLFSTVVTYAGGRILQKLDSDKNRKLCLTLCIVLNLAVLGYYKYFTFIISYFNRVLTLIGISTLSVKEDILLPVGISFYTLQTLGYLIDVYRKRISPEHNFLYYALFVSFFPQLVAGPIERTENLLGQLIESHRFDYENIRRGIMLILYGLFIKLVIADRASVMVDTVYTDTVGYPGFYIIAATAFFAIQIYCDFYGYSTIARGSALLMGIHLMDNFNAPYYAKSVKEFWHRWHISLSGWFRDYLYIPLGGNRKGALRRGINLLMVFAVSGLWHGAALSFAFWGFLNGAYQIMANIKVALYDRIFGIKCKVPSGAVFSQKLLHIVGTFCLVTFSWLFFRAGSMQNALCVLKNMSRLDNWYILLDGSLVSLVGGSRPFNILLLAITILFVVDFFKYKEMDVVGFVLSQQFWFRYLVQAILFFAILLYGHYGEAYEAQQFIYFQF